MTKAILPTLLCCLCLSYAPHLFAQNEKLSQALNAQVSVSGEMTTDKFQQLIKNGFKSVIVNRPDQEQGNRISVSQLRQIAEQSHVSVIYQPIVNGQTTQTDVIEFSKYYKELPKPILMVCRSGSRSSILFNQAKSQGLLHE